MGWPTKAERAARKAAMTTTTEPAVDLTAVMERLERLEAENAELKAKQTQFVPMKRDPQPERGGYRPPEVLQPRTLVKKAGDENNGSVSMYDSPEFRNGLPPALRPAFVVGNLVRLNPDAIVFGSEKRDEDGSTIAAGITWAERLGKRIEVTGEVLATLGRMRNFEPKYRVFIQGITGRNGEGYRESELIPA